MPSPSNDRSVRTAVGISGTVMTCSPVSPAREGTSDARENFATWYRDAHPRLVGALAWVGGDQDAVRDAVDESCARALARWDRVATMASPTGWAYQVALNVWRRRQRRAAVERRLLRRHPPPRPVVAGPAGEAWDLVRTLPVRERTAIALRYVGDLTELQIAEVMGVRRSTVSVLLTRAHRRLEPLLDDARDPSTRPDER